MSHFAKMIHEMRGESTVIMITSRPSIINIADKVLHVEERRVTEHKDEALEAVQ